jgi:hypothetical protein
MRAAFRTIRLFAGWVITGTLTGLFKGILLYLFLNRHSSASDDQQVVLFCA